ncbi:uncharacterized protein LOC125657033 isoform X2 [Ostrea edulis]|uniref:uncharacterized protein LOC125657033 isoform X2 n=1 Tax=Ostrea edulis TaxID=37623 RepID=UPI0024AEF720|nr:uncharacterized protein LOC125657033 isoform X2 [Ostrea edulis]
MSVRDLWNWIVYLTLGLFLLGFHCRSLTADYTFHAVEVDSCPRNRSEWMAASEGLNCTENSSTNNFHCVPNYNLTHLLQFCYDSDSALFEAGYCVVLSRSSSLDALPCSQFIEGKCPANFYISNMMYEVPACLEIDSECYNADPTCTRATPQQADTTTFTENSSEHWTASTMTLLTTAEFTKATMAVPIVLGVIIPTLSMIVVIMVCRKMEKQGRGDLPSNSGEERNPLISNSGAVSSPTRHDEIDALNHSGVGNPESEVHNVQSITDKVLQKHIKDKTYVRTTAVNAALTCLEERYVVILTGKEGEGKTKAAYQLLHEMSQKSFVPLNVKSMDQWSRIVNANYQYAVLLDDIVSAASESKSFVDEILSCAGDGKVNVIIVCREKELEVLKTIHPVCELFDTPDYTVNLSSLGLKTEEKRCILMQYEKVRNRKLKDEDRDEILKIDTFFGFPYTCSLFFGRGDFFNQGPSFFSRTNSALLRRIKKLHDIDASRKTKISYCVLCFIFENGSLNVSQFDEQLLAEIAGIIRVADIRPSDVSNVVSDLNGDYLMETSDTDVYNFIHETVREAVCISYGELALQRVIEKCPRKTLNAVARIANYQEKPEEVVLKIPKQNYDVFAKRMLLDNLEEEKIVENIIINHCSSDCDFVKVLLTCAVPPSCDMPKILSMLWDRLITDRHTALLENMLEIYGPHIAAFSQESGYRTKFNINRNDINELIQNCLIFQKEDKILVLMKYVRKNESLYDIASFMYTRKGHRPMTLMQYCVNHGWGDVLGELQAIDRPLNGN